jgi:hypothetical protein
MTLPRTQGRQPQLRGGPNISRSGPTGYRSSTPTAAPCPPIASAQSQALLQSKAIDKRPNVSSSSHNPETPFPFRQQDLIGNRIWPLRRGRMLGRNPHSGVIGFALTATQNEPSRCGRVADFPAPPIAPSLFIPAPPRGRLPALPDRKTDPLRSGANRSLRASAICRGD